ncbi:MAG TPA: acyl carrier protein [Longimicrobiales bacterium]|nr:acyl carrier protein [Longimicrobiales bacterium]
MNTIPAADETGQRLRQVMGAVFGIDASTISPDASSATIAEWDSVRHLQLMLALEEEFNVQFETDELVSLRTLPLIEQRLRTETP